MTTALSIEEVGFRFGDKTALSDVSLEVPVGSFTVLLGPNGAGKTTLFSLITGLYHSKTGSIKILGHELSLNTREALTAIGVVFQRPTLDLDLSVVQNLRYHAALHGISASNTAQRIDAILKRHSLEKLEHRKINQLSGGERRRIELVRALLHKPKLLLLDEATVGLDIGSRRSFIEHVRSLCHEEEVGVLWATHLIDEVDMKDQVVVLDKGKVLRSARASQIIQELNVLTMSDAFTLLTKSPSR